MELGVVGVVEYGRQWGVAVAVVVPWVQTEHSAIGVQKHYSKKKLLQ